MKWVFLLIVGLLLFSCLLAFPYRFTVREVGFVDIVPQSYYLYCYVDDQTEAGVISVFNQIVFAHFIDTNVESEVINISQFSSHHAAKYIEEWGAEKLPTVVLVSPDDTSIAFPLPSNKDGIWNLVERIIRSGKRDQILEAIIQTYGVVLFVEGKNLVENQKANSAIRLAIARVKDKMVEMPKPVNELPKVITLPYQQRDQEKNLLWSLTREIELRGSPSTGGLVKTLLLIGADCECGLDRSTVLGTMIPLKWDRSMQSNLVEKLGFDPENPMIKNEISQILFEIPAFPGQDTFEDPLLGYAEFAVTFGSESAIDLVEKGSHSPIDSNVSESSDSVTPPVWLSLIVVIFLGIAILNSGILVFLRNRKGS